MYWPGPSAPAGAAIISPQHRAKQCQITRCSTGMAALGLQAGRTSNRINRIMSKSLHLSRQRLLELLSGRSDGAEGLRTPPSGTARSAGTQRPTHHTKEGKKVCNSMLKYHRSQHAQAHHTDTAYIQYSHGTHTARTQHTYSTHTHGTHCSPYIPPRSGSRGSGRWPSRRMI